MDNLTLRMFDTPTLTKLEKYEDELGKVEFQFTLGMLHDKVIDDITEEIYKHFGKDVMFRMDMHPTIKITIVKKDKKD